MMLTQKKIKHRQPPRGKGHNLILCVIIIKTIFSTTRKVKIIDKCEIDMQTIQPQIVHKGPLLGIMRWNLILYEDHYV